MQRAFRSKKVFLPVVARLLLKNRLGTAVRLAEDIDLLGSFC